MSASSWVTRRIAVPSSRERAWSAAHSAGPRDRANCMVRQTEAHAACAPAPVRSARASPRPTTSRKPDARRDARSSTRPAPRRPSPDAGIHIVIRIDRGAAEKSRQHNIPSASITGAGQHQIVRHDAKKRAQVKDVPRVLPENCHRRVVPRHRIALARDRLDQCRLAAAVRSENGDVLVGANRRLKSSSATFCPRITRRLRKSSRGAVKSGSSASKV